MPAENEGHFLKDTPAIVDTVAVIFCRRQDKFGQADVTRINVDRSFFKPVRQPDLQAVCPLLDRGQRVGCDEFFKAQKYPP
jgi:acyl-coenzyme A thioesterase PaaI-like protein